jgi:carbon storage regulator
MLVLSRRVKEQIVISNNIVVTVVSVRGDKVRLGVVAPSDVTVDRQEVHERRVAAAAAASGSPISKKTV